MCVMLSSQRSEVLTAVSVDFLPVCAGVEISQPPPDPSRLGGLRPRLFYLCRAGQSCQGGAGEDRDWLGTSVLASHRNLDGKLMNTTGRGGTDAKSSVAPCS